MVGKSVKIAIAGKGGVGKTTISGTLSRLLAKDGLKVYAIDADPAMNLWISLGIDKKNVESASPLSENDILVEERTGAKPGSIGGVFSLTPKVHDISEKYGVSGPDGVKLLILGTVKSGGIGCMCPANSLLKALMRHLLISQNDAVVLDMEAGLEHLGRGVVKGVDVLINVVEPSYRSIQTSIRVKKLADELEVENVIVVGNRITNQKEENFLRNEFKALNQDLLSIIPYDPAISEAEMNGKAPIDYNPTSPAMNALIDLEMKLKEKYVKISRKD